ncbi:MAG: branched-chain amino acid ABC transporter permease [Firmicutes bacterium]|nr:branched-chain amino acid ABC transporter permease [Bacillota bacterium]MBQ3199033.1 branched-chain amino acid ABC transporter permease [Bacillota bacterium]
MNKILTKKNIAALLLIVAIYAVLLTCDSMGLFNRQTKALLVPIGINIMLAVSLNLMVGFLGELSLGHAGFMSVGAYAGCIFTIHAEMPMWLELPLAMLLGGVVAGVFGLLIGIPALRLRGDYLAIVTLAFGEIIRAVLNNVSLVGGAGGLNGIPKYSNYTIVYVMAVITIIIIANLVKSRHGRAICSIRDNIIASEAMGIPVVKYKLMAFIVAAFFAGIAGVLYGHNLGILKPSTFDFNKSIEILVMVVMGGMGSLPGSIIAAFLITVLPEALRSLQDYRMLIYAVVLIAMMLLNNNARFNEFKQRIFSKKATRQGANLTKEGK